MLRRKLIRDLLRQRGLIAAIVLVIFLGVALFVGSYLAYENLRDSYRDIQVRTRTADYVIQVGTADNGSIREVMRVPGVEAAELQVVVDLPVIMPTSSDSPRTTSESKPTARLISIPVEKQPDLNQIVVVSGHYPTRLDEVLVERHFADYFGLHEGDTVQVETPAAKRRLVVSGVGVTSEYLWVSRSRQDVMPSPSGFGVLFVPRETLMYLGQNALASALSSDDLAFSGQLSALQLASTWDGGNSLLVRLTPGANGESVISELKEVLGRDNLISATPRSELPGIQLLQLDVDGFQQVAIAFPFFFLAVGGFVVLSVLSRQIDQERMIIGTMQALGMRSGQVLRHYIAYGLVIGLVGAVLGAAAGIALGNEMTSKYAAELYIPFVTTRVDWPIVAIGLVAGLAVPGLAGILPARRASRLQPAEAMRSRVPLWVPGSESVIASLVRAFPFWLKVPLRDLGRHPARSLGSAAGIASAAILITTTAGMFDSLARGVDLAFNKSQRYDLRADFYWPRSAAAIEGSIANITGIRQSETMLALPVRLRNPRTGKTYDTVLQGIPDRSPLLHVLDASGSELHPGPDDAILTKSVASEMGLKVGDVVAVTRLPNGSTTDVRIGQLADALMGNSIILTAADAADRYQLFGMATTLLVSVEPGDIDAVTSQLQNLTAVAQVTDLHAVRGQITNLMGLMYVFLGMMVLFARSSPERYCSTPRR
jgi:putative ABC transport system permease protein